MNKVRKAILIVILAGTLLMAGCNSNSTPQVPEVPEGSNQAPDFQLQTPDGQDISLSNLRGKPVLINFWATRCPPCIYEMPFLQQVYEEWSGKGLVVLAINSEDSASKISEFMQSNNFSFTALLDPGGSIALKYGIRYIPTTFLINKDGIIQGIKTGPFQSKEEIEAGIRTVFPS